MNIHSLIYKVTGRMTKTQVVRTAENIGYDLLSKAQKNGDVFVEDIREVLESRIGKKAASRITITDNLKTFKSFLSKHLGLSDDLSEMYFYDSKAAAVPGGNSNKFLFKINMQNFDNLAEKLNTITHECEHLLFKGVSFRAYFERLYMKIKGKKWLNKYVEKFAELVNKKNLSLQLNLLGVSQVGGCALGGFTKFKKGINGLLKQSEFQSRAQLHDFLRTNIRRDILLPQGDKRNLTLIKSLIGILKDESRAYRAGGRVEAKLLPNSDKITNSEMLAQLYDETIKVLTKEKNLERKNRIRNFFGLARKEA